MCAIIWLRGCCSDWESYGRFRVRCFACGSTHKAAEGDKVKNSSSGVEVGAKKATKELKNEDRRKVNKNLVERELLRKDAF